MLTFAVLMTPYIGAALSYAAEASKRLPYMSRVVHCVAVLLLAHSGLQVIALGLTQTGDSRVSVERFLESLPMGTTVETYGLTVYQIRYVAEEAPYRLTRIGTKEPSRRNPLPGVVELKAPFMAVTERAPDVIIVPMAFANRYLRDTPSGAGRATKGSIADLDAQHFFSTAVTGRLVGYQRSHLVDVAFPSWAIHLGMSPRRIQSSTGTRNIVLLRDQFEPNIDLSEAIY